MKVIIKKTWRRKIVYLEDSISPALLTFLQQIDKKTTQTQDNPLLFLKKGDTTTVLLTEIEGTKWVIKKYNLVGWWGKIKRALTPSRASRCWRFALFLKQLGVNAPTPLAYIEKRWGPFSQEAYFISSYIPGVNALDYFLKDDERRSILETTKQARDIVSQLKKMFQVGITHGDMKATNIILNSSGVFFIDLDAMRRYKNNVWFEWSKKKNLLRFKKNWHKKSSIQALFSALLREYFIEP